MTDTYNDRSGDKGGQNAGNSDVITENSPAEGTTDQDTPHGGPGVAGGVTGTEGRDRENPRDDDSAWTI